VGSTATGKWIGPQANTGGSAGGVYIYDLQFDLTGIDETQIQIRGDWSTDNTHAPPHGILLNGNLIAGTQDPDQFDRRAPFTIQRGNPAFQPGINTLSFILENQGAGFTGLKVDGLRGLAPAADSEWIADLFSTGVDNAHVPLPAGSPDPHWTVNGAGPATAQTNHPAWAENGTGSSWISTVADGQAPILATQYVFETTFTIAANLDPSTAIILGRMAADNVVDEVFLNGVPLGISHVGFDTMVDFTIDSGFVSGTNTLTVLMSNLPPDGPGGFRMELDGFASIPEPSSVVLMGLAGLGLAVVARRRRLG
jgi:hypothetical protein